MSLKTIIMIIASLVLLSGCQADFSKKECADEPEKKAVEETMAAEENKEYEIDGYTRMSFDESEPANEMVSIGRYMGDDTKSEHLEGLIDTNGKVICPFIYKMAWDSSEGYSIVGINAENTDKDYYDPFGNLLDEEKLKHSIVYTYVNIKGEECFGYYTDAKKFSEGIAFVKGAENCWYALDQKGNLTKLDESIQWIDPFSEGFAKFRNKSNGNIGFINHDFEIVIPAIYSSADDFSEGLAAATLNGYDLIYIDKKGSTVIETDYEYHVVAYDTMRYFKASIDSYSFHEGVAFLPGCRSQTAVSDHYIDKNGNIAIDNIYGSSFSHGLAPAKDGIDNIGFIDKTGTFVIPAQYHSASAFNEYGTAFVYSKECIPDELAYTYDEFYGYYCGCINTKGEVVIPLEYYCNDYLHGFPNTANGIFRLHKDGYIHYFKSDGTLIGKLEELEGAAEMYEKY